MEMQASNNETMQQRYDRLASNRYSVLERARDAAKLTIPSLLPPEGFTESQTLPEPYQGLGARGVNNLASKLLLALIPPNQKFFRLSPDSQVMEQMSELDPSAISKIKQELSKVESNIMTDIETHNTRAKVFEAMRLLVSTGNALVHMPADGDLTVYRLDQYVIRRDKAGNVIEIVIKEEVSPDTLDKEVIDKCEVHEDAESVDVYTHVRRATSKWRVSQEINDIKVPGSAGTYPFEKNAYIPLRWTSMSMDNYGRSLVDEHMGDLRSFEAISQSMIEFAANASRLIWLVSPNGMTRRRDLEKAVNGEFVAGHDEDVTALMMDKFPDFRVVQEVSVTIQRRLEQGFLLHTAVQRDAERVTAQEIQYLAQELEDALGGVYSVLAQEFQVPFLNRKMVQLQRQNKIPSFPKESINPQITTGLEALGRSRDIIKLNNFLSNVAQLPEHVQQRLEPGDLLRRLAAGHGIDTTGLVKSEEQIAQEQQQAQMAQAAQESAPGVAQEAAKAMANQQQQRGE